MSPFRKALLFSLLIGSLLGCRKSEEDPQPAAADISAHNTSHSMAQFLAAHRSPMQVFTADAGQPIHLVAQQGTLIDIPLGHLWDDNGQAVTGPVQIELTEVMSVSDIILHEKPTVCNGQLLISQAEFSLQVKQNGIPVGGGAIVSTPVAAGDGYSPPFSLMFTGGLVGNNPDSEPQFTWFQNFTQNTPVKADSVPMVVSGGKEMYQNLVYLDSRSWKNYDVFWGYTGTRSTLTGTWSSPAQSAPKLYVSMRDARSVGRLFPDGHTFSSQGEFIGLDVPDHAAATLVAFQFENDRFYYGKQLIMTGTGIAPHLELKEISEADLVKALDALM